MLSVQVLCIGKLKEKYLVQGCQEYAKRLQSFCKLTVTELPETRLHDSVDSVLADEGQRLLAKLPAGGYHIALCVEGQTCSSPQLSQLLQKKALAGISQFTFVIGGSYGLHEQVKKACQMRLSVSPMTFPHQLFRLMLLEQIYRAFSIGANTKYHK